MKKYTFILLVFLLFIRCSSSTERESDDPFVEKCFLKKFESMNAKIQVYEEKRSYKIMASKEKKDSASYFGWISFEIDFFNDSSEAKAELVKIRTGNVDRFKAPEYIIRHSNKIYSISSGCFNVDGVEMAFGIFRSCLELNKPKEEDLIVVECGGRLLQPKL